MPDQNLITFVQQQRAARINDQETIQQLQNQGWDYNQIIEAVNAAGQSYSPQPPNQGQFNSQNPNQGQYNSQQPFGTNTPPLTAATKNIVTAFIGYGLISWAITTIPVYLLMTFAFSALTFASGGMGGAGMFGGSLFGGTSSIAIGLIGSIIGHGVFGIIIAYFGNVIFPAIGSFIPIKHITVFKLFFYPGIIISILFMVPMVLLFITVPMFLIPFGIMMLLELIAGFIFSKGTARSIKNNLGIEYIN